MNIKKIPVFFILAFAAFSIFAQDNDTDSKAGSRKFIDGKIVEADKAKRYAIEATYPQLVERSVQAGAFNKAVKDHVTGLVNEFKSDVYAMTDEDRRFLPEDVDYTFDLGYEIGTAGPAIISVDVGVETYTGGAHGAHWSTPLNFDMRSGKTMKLANLFKPGSGYIKLISDICISDLKKQMKDSADYEWIGNGAGPKEENFKSWVVTAEGLKFIFDEYQVGPYVAGAFEVVVPYERFPRAMRSDSFQPLEMLSYIDGNPPNWCRGGHFPQADVDFSVMKVNGGKTTRAYFYGDDGDCPNGANCRERAYVIGGDEVIASRSYGDFVCAWYQPAKGTETVGWIKMSDLRPGYASEGPASFTGEWVYGESDLKIEVIGAGALSVKGNSFWRGLGDNIHIGEVDDSGTPVGNILAVGGSDEYDCRMKLRRVGDFLVVSDNKNCGGVNVSFDGVYRKRK
jgi:hypothetical protein